MSCSCRTEELLSFGARLRLVFRVVAHRPAGSVHANDDHATEMRFEAWACRLGDARPAAAGRGGRLLRLLCGSGGSSASSAWAGFHPTARSSCRCKADPGSARRWRRREPLLARPARLRRDHLPRVGVGPLADRPLSRRGAGRALEAPASHSMRRLCSLA